MFGNTPKRYNEIRTGLLGSEGCFILHKLSVPTAPSVVPLSKTFYLHCLNLLQTNFYPGRPASNTQEMRMFSLYRKDITVILFISGYRTCVKKKCYGQRTIYKFFVGVCIHFYIRVINFKICLSTYICCVEA